MARSNAAAGRFYHAFYKWTVSNTAASTGVHPRNRTGIRYVSSDGVRSQESPEEMRSITNNGPWGLGKEKTVRVDRDKPERRFRLDEEALEAFRLHRATPLRQIARRAGCAIGRDQMRKFRQRDPATVGTVAVSGSPEAVEKGREMLQREADKWCEELGIAPTRVVVEDIPSGEPPTWYGSHALPADAAPSESSDKSTSIEGEASVTKARIRRIGTEERPPVEGTRIRRMYTTVDAPASVDNVERSKGTSKAPTAQSSSEHTMNFLLPSTFAANLRLNNFGALLSTRVNSGCSLVDFPDPFTERKTIRIRAVGTPEATSHARKELQSLVSHVCRDKRIPDVKIRAISQADVDQAQNRMARDNTRTALRAFTSPVAVLMTRAHSPSTSDQSAFAGCHGVTISSLSPVTLSPCPVISFNLAADSRTYAALQAAGTFHIYFLSATPLGAKIATAFTKPYELSSAPFEALRQSGVDVKVARENRAPIIHSKAVLASLRATLKSGSVSGEGSVDVDEVPASVKVGDKFVIFAKVTNVLLWKGVHEGETALAYAGRKYRAGGSEIVPGDDAGDIVDQLVKSEGVEKVAAATVLEVTDANVSEAKAVETVAVDEKPESECETDDFFHIVENELAGEGVSAAGSEEHAGLKAAAADVETNLSSDDYTQGDRAIADNDDTVSKADKANGIPRSVRQASGSEPFASESQQPASPDGFRQTKMPTAPMFTTPSRVTSRPGLGSAPSNHTQRSFSSSTPRPFFERLRSNQPEPTPVKEDIKVQTVAEFFGPTLHTRPPPRTWHILNSRRIIEESSAELEDILTADPGTSIEAAEFQKREGELREQIATHTRRINRSLAKNSAKDLRAMLDTGKVNHRLIAYMEHQLERGIEVARGDAERAKTALERGELDDETFGRVKERVLADYSGLAAELGRLRQVVEEEMDDMDEDD